MSNNGSNRENKILLSRKRVGMMDVSIGELNTLDEAIALASFDHFLLKDRIAGEHQLYRGYDTESFSDIIIKIVLPHTQQNQEKIQNLQENFKLFSTLAHPYLASLKYLHRIETLNFNAQNEPIEYGDYCVLLDDFEGINLTQWLNTLNKKLDLTLALNLCDQLSQVLDYLHSRSVVYPQLSMDDIFMTSGGELKLLATKFLNKQTITSVSVGGSESVKELINVYRSIAYELLTGEKLSQALDLGEMQFDRKQRKLLKKLFKLHKTSNHTSCIDFYKELCTAYKKMIPVGQPCDNIPQIDLEPLADLPYKKLKQLYDKSLSVWALSELLIFMSLFLLLNLTRGEMNYNSIAFGGITLIINSLAIVFLFKRVPLGRYLGIIAYSLLFTSIFTAVLGALGVLTFLTASKAFGPHRYDHKEMKKELRYRKHHKLFT
ncbi:protein kinase [Lentisphaera profundi]|uniref:Protein kinase n=1 Tax=Lentisphaera profundi TaxID=1658616 RepID=A0ABY7VWF8_9BACT|nr:protein kinase [Lentisphaera profundi]WDE98571.1 protein kinase [Lentisphaera profundi]